MSFTLVNFFNTTLSAASSSTATTFTVSSSTNLPTLASGEILPITLNDAATRQVFEICYVTEISGNVLTVERAQEGTSAQNWNIGDFIWNGPTAGTALLVGNNSGMPYDISSGVSGPIAGSQYVMDFLAVRSVNVPANFGGSLASVLTAFTDAATYMIYHNGTSVGTISFAASGTTGTFSTSSAFTMAVGDSLTIQSPSTADATAANLSITILASLA